MIGLSMPNKLGLLKICLLLKANVHPNISNELSSRLKSAMLQVQRLLNLISRVYFCKKAHICDVG